MQAQATQLQRLGRLRGLGFALGVLACFFGGCSAPPALTQDASGGSKTGHDDQGADTSYGAGDVAAATGPHAARVKHADTQSASDPKPWDDLSWLGEQRPPQVATTLADPTKVGAMKTLDEVDGKFSKIRIQQQASRREMVFVAPNGRTHRQSQVETQRTYELHSPYAKAIVAALLVRPVQRRVLIVGLGGGTLVHFFQHYAPAMEIDVIEIDPGVITMASKWFAIAPRDAAEGVGALRIHEADAVAALTTGAQAGVADAPSDDGLVALQGPWDAIYLDAYLIEGAEGTDSDGVPRDQKSDAFLRALRSQLAPGGIAAFNVHFTPKWEAYRDSIAAVFEHVSVIEPIKAQHRLVVASQEPLPSEEDVRARATQLGKSRSRLATVLLEGTSVVTSLK